MIIRFPESLPKPTRNYSVDIENSAVRSNMDSGRIRQRRRFTASQNSLSVKWELTDEEFQIFESFVFHALSGGTGWFEADLLTGNGIVPHKVRFQKGRYKAAYRGFMNWLVTATLDVDDINRLTEEELVDQLYGANLLATELRSALDTYLPNS